MDIFLRMMLFLLRILSMIVSPIFWLVSKRKVKKVPPISNPLLLLSATTLANKIRKRDIKSETVVRAYIERIKEVNSLLNAIVEERFEEAVQEARQVDVFLETTITDIEQLQTSQPLLGVPITVKETCCVKGMRHTAGSNRRKDFRANEDGIAVERMRQAGGIILLVSNTPEFCLYWETNNMITGRTNNPYNTHYSSAGSSGGEGALVGAGASIIGLGSDIAGSIRLPALFNGVFGHKGSPKLVPYDGHFPGVQCEIGKTNLALGPIVRYAEDLSLAFNVLTKDTDKLDLDTEVDMKALNVFYMLEANTCIAQIPVDSEIKQAINKCVKHLQHVCGSKVDEFKFSLNNSLEINTAVFFHSMKVPNILGNPFSAKQSDWVIFELFKKLFGCSKYSLNGLIFALLKISHGFLFPWQKNQYLKELEFLKQQFNENLSTNGVLLYPTFPTSACQHNQYIFKLSGVQYLGIFNNLELPCTNIPLGVGKNGLPIGIQVVAGPRQDKLCFAVAKELEKAFGGWSPPI